jgi:hypothetical protein
MLTKAIRFSLAFLACLTALSFSTVGTAAESDDDEEETESRTSRKKTRKAPAAADEDEDDTSSRKSRERKARRSEPDEDEDEDEDDEPKPKKPVEAPTYSQRTGFVLQTSLLTQTTAFNAGTVAFQLSSLEGGLAFGYKTGRFMLGLGFDYTTLSDTTRQLSTTTYSFVVYPEVQYAFVQSADQRVELVGNASVGFGSFGASRSDVDADNTTQLRVRWRVGPGVRYWLHPQLGAALVTGVTGNHLFVFSPSGSALSSTLTTSLYTQIGIVGVF